MRADRRQIGHAGDVAAGLLERGHELGAERIGDGGEHDRDVLGRRGDRLGRGRRDRHDHVRRLADEFLGDLRRGRRIALGALELEVEVLAGLVALRRQLVLNALAHRVERRMLDDRGHGDGDVRRRGGARQAEAQGQRGRQPDRKELGHACLLLSVTVRLSARP